MKTIKCIATVLVIFVMTVLLSMSLSAQVQRSSFETIANGKIISVPTNSVYPWEFYKMTQIKGVDTLIVTAFKIEFINMEYTYLKDYTSIIFIDRSELHKFINDIKQICSGSFNDLSIVNTEYRIDTYKDKSKVFISNPENEYFILTSKQAMKLVTDIEVYVDNLKEFEI